ncbi:MAG: hypothetical protein M3619_28875 [Myxococcota bacterium]|nr:hypothetical protein [Myxococcota bacterium]
MLQLISIIFQFAFTAADPSWSCELTHRDPAIAGTYYFYCAQMTADGVELIQVGRFISDARAGKAVL